MITWSRFGPNALLFRFAEKADEAALNLSLAFAAELERRPIPGLKEWVPSITCLLLEWEKPINDSAQRAATVLTQLAEARPVNREAFPLHRIPVRYEGEDLAEFAEAAKISPEELIALHSGPEYRVMMIGFGPGFAYLGPLDPRLHRPRRSTPRVRVPAGSVAIGGEHTAVYPYISPGGWHLIGQTSAKLFYPERNDRSAFVLQPGDRVRFEPV